MLNREQGAQHIANKEHTEKIIANESIRTSTFWNNPSVFVQQDIYYTIRDNGDGTLQMMGVHLIQYDSLRPEQSHERTLISLDTTQLPYPRVKVTKNGVSTHVDFDRGKNPWISEVVDFYRNKWRRDSRTTKLTADEQQEFNKNPIEVIRRELNNRLDTLAEETE